MQLEQELAGFTSSRDRHQAMGVFDRVHLGHKLSILKFKELARQRDYSSMVITFDKYPQKVLKPQSPPLFLTDTAEKSALLTEGSGEAVISLNACSGLPSAGPCECAGL